MAIDYTDRIPNNVDLAGDRRLQRALEAWQPRYLDWWRTVGPEGFQDKDVFLRTAVSVGADGWAHFDHVRLPEYRWGIFLAEPEPGRRIHFGEHLGEAAWQEVPGEYRTPLRRLIVVQGDTEPASVEQQARLGRTCPSLYDLRNLFQINVEEGRHLWAMVYLLHAHFGRDGREEAEALLDRRSGDVDRPRVLGAFNEPTDDWLSFFMFTYFTDRDGKFQLEALSESAFDPLARTTRFMLREEAHHMFVGTFGVDRVVRRTCELMREHDTEDVEPLGGINLDTVQRYINLHYSLSLDLFGSELSSNAATYYAQGLKGRFHEAARRDDHRLTDAVVRVPALVDGGLTEVDAPALTALNETLRDDYVVNCEKGMERWNATIEAAGVERRLRLPHRAFHRQVGTFAGAHVTPDGRVIDGAAWEAGIAAWLPNSRDREHVASLMVPVVEPGRMAGWIAAPKQGIDGRPLDYEYVRLG